MNKYLSFVFAGLLVSGFAVAGDSVVSQENVDAVAPAIVKTDSASADFMVKDEKKKDKKRQKGKKKFDSERHANKLAKHLDLTEAQVNELKEIRSQFEKTHPKPDFKSMTKEDRISWFEVNKDAFSGLKEDLAAVLTPEQQEKAKVFYQKKSQKYQKFKEKRASKE